MAKEKLLKEEQYLVDKYGDNLVGLIAYGSMVFGKPRRGSFRDYWVIYRDYQTYHKANEEFYKTALNFPSTVEKMIELNKGGVVFHYIDDPESGIRIKTAVAQEEDLYTFCTNNTMEVKGRMQKPVKFIRKTERIEEAINAARAEGAQDGLNLVPTTFTFDDFLFAVVSLSYRAEIRIESVDKKVRSIIDKGRKELEAIYLPMLEAMEHVEHVEGMIFRDTREPGIRSVERKTTLRKLRAAKWGRHQFHYLYRNYLTFKNPGRYVWAKLVGEAGKLFRSICVYPFFRRYTAERMVREYSNEIDRHFDLNGAPVAVSRLFPLQEGSYEIHISAGDTEKSLLCVPLSYNRDEGDEIARDTTLRFALIAR